MDLSSRFQNVKTTSLRMTAIALKMTKKTKKRVKRMKAKALIALIIKRIIKRTLDNNFRSHTFSLV